MISKCDLPRLFVCVSSSGSSWEDSRNRILFQGAAVVRFANGFLDAFKSKKDFVLTVILMSEEGFVIYQLFQKENSREVSRVLCANRSAN
jgi:hypothetical protein